MFPFFFGGNGHSGLNRLDQLKHFSDLIIILMDSDMSPKSVLLVGQDGEFLKGTKTFLTSKGYRVKTVSKSKKAIENVISENPQFVLLCSDLQGFPEEELIKRIKKINQDIAVIVAGPTGSERERELKKLGVGHFLKETEPHLLLTALNQAGSNPPPSEGKKSGMDSLLEKFLPFWAHEIRNPLQAIGGAMTIIERRANIEDRALAQSINIVKEEVQTLTDFVQECLDYIKPPNRSHWGEININETLILVLNLMPFMFKGLFEQITVTTHFDPQLFKVYANYEEIKKVFLNIFKNGFESMAKTEKKELTLQTVNQIRHKTGWVDIVIRDTGEGIKKENVEFIGTPFFTTKLRGTGMGLVICNRIIAERHNGKLSIKGQENQGTTVTISLPVNQEKNIGGV